MLKLKNVFEEQNQSFYLNSKATFSFLSLTSSFWVSQCRIPPFLSLKHNDNYFCLGHFPFFLLLVSLSIIKSHPVWFHSFSSSLNSEVSGSTQKGWAALLEQPSVLFKYQEWLKRHSSNYQKTRKGKAVWSNSCNFNRGISGEGGTAQTHHCSPRILKVHFFHSPMLLFKSHFNTSQLPIIKKSPIQAKEG